MRELTFLANSHRVAVVQLICMILLLDCTDWILAWACWQSSSSYIAHNILPGYIEPGSGVHAGGRISTNQGMTIKH